jgi:hypothetical protein
MGKQEQAKDSLVLRAHLTATDDCPTGELNLEKV